jgi:serine/threonine protein kinase
MSEFLDPHWDRKRIEDELTRTLPGVNLDRQLQAGTPAFLEIGRLILGHYRVIGKLGAGGMGEVYLVEDEESRILFAMKRPIPYVKADTLHTQEEHRQAIIYLLQFCQESEVWIAMGLHQNIVTAYFLEVFEDSILLFLEYIPGTIAECIPDTDFKKGTILKDWMQKWHSPDEKLLCAFQIACGMQHAHECNILHRDLKPGNILVTQDEKTQENIFKITDFGLATTVGEAADTCKGRGTYAYMAPEQFDNTIIPDKRCDIYSFGVILYELLAGSRPFYVPLIGNKKQQRVEWEKLHKEETPDFSKLPPETPEAVKVLVQKCLAKDKNNRPEFFAEIAATLAHVTGSTVLTSAKIAAESLPYVVNNKAVSLLRLAQIAESSKKEKYIAQAEALLQKVQGSGYYPIQFNLALCQLRRETAQGKAFLEQFWSATQPDQTQYKPEFVSARAFVALEYGGFVTASWEEVQKALQEHSQDKRLLSAAAFLQYRLRNWSECRKFLAQIPQEAYSPEHWACLGATFWEEGLQDEAKKIWNEGAQAYPKDRTLQKLPQGSLDSSGTMWSEVRTLQNLEYFCDFKQTLNGKYYISRSEASPLRIWDLATDKCLHTLQCLTSSCGKVALTPDGKYCISGSSDKTLRIWDLATDKCLHTLQGHTSDVDAVAITPDGKYCISGSQDYTLRIWDIASGQCLHTLQGHTSGVTAIAVTPDSKFCISGSGISRSGGGTLRIWDIATGQCLHTHEGREPVAVTPDGKYCISGYTLRIWDIATSQCLHTLTDRVTAVAVTPDSKFCISGSHDCTLRIWEIATGKCMQVLSGHTDRITVVAVTPDGLHAISGSWDKTVKVWRLEMQWQDTSREERPEPAQNRQLIASLQKMMLDYEQQQSWLAASNLARQILYLDTFSAPAHLDYAKYLDRLVLAQQAKADPTLRIARAHLQRALQLDAGLNTAQELLVNVEKELQEMQGR